MERAGVVIRVCGCEVIVDEADATFVANLGLSIVRRGDLCHVVINTQPYYKKYLHRVLLNITKSSVIVDHINSNGLDNRRSNLRLTTKVGNALNMPANRNKKSGLPKGVYRERNGFKACIQINGLNKYLGHYNTPEEAEVRYKKELAKYWEAHAGDGTDNWT